MVITIIDSSLSHVRSLSNNLREGDKKEIQALGLDQNKAVYHSFRYSFYRKTALIDGQVAAMWGVAGTPLGLSGAPYLITSPLVETISPVQFAKIYIRETKEMKRFFPILENYVDASYTGAVRMLEIAGYKLSAPIKVNNQYFYKFSMQGDL